jgi:tetratricopeptide (TPR) repeat protein
MVIRDGIDFTWGGMALLRKELNYDFLFKMRRAGCVEICWGLESGSASVLQLMRKNNFNPQMAEEIFKMANELGFQQYTNIIVGFPGETEEMFLETAQFVLRNKKYFGSMGLPLLAIRKNSYLYNNYHKYNIESPDTNEWRTIDNSNTHELRIVRRNLLKGILEDKLFDQGHYDENKIKEASGATRTCEESILTETNDREKAAVSNLIRLGEKFFSEGNHNDAFELFMRIAEVAPDNYENWNNLAVTYISRELFDEAERCLKNAVALKADYEEARTNLKRIKDIKEALLLSQVGEQNAECC